MKKTKVKASVIEVCLSCETENTVSHECLTEETPIVRCEGCDCVLVPCSICVGTLEDITHCTTSDCVNGNGFKLREGF